MTLVALIRHGYHTDQVLSHVEIARLGRIANKLASRYGLPNMLISSPLPRAVSTMLAFKQGADVGHDITKDPRLGDASSNPRFSPALIAEIKEKAARENKDAEPLLIAAGHPAALMSYGMEGASAILDAVAASQEGIIWATSHSPRLELTLLALLESVSELNPPLWFDRGGVAVLEFGTNCRLKRYEYLGDLT